MLGGGPLIGASYFHYGVRHSIFCRRITRKLNPSLAKKLAGLKNLPKSVNYYLSGGCNQNNNCILYVEEKRH